jgi:prenyl protein peptidase
MTLFLGPMVQNAIDYQAGQNSRGADKYDWHETDTYFMYKHRPAELTRNLFMGPWAEEVVFRCCMLPLLLSAGFTMGQSVLGSPLFFGVAHVHHLYEHIYKERWPVGRAVLISTVQFTYTSIFGMYVAFVFVRTGHLVGIGLAHTFCNFMGLPDFGGAFSHPTHKPIVLAAYAIGITGFYYGLFPATDPAIYGSIFATHGLI